MHISCIYCVTFRNKFNNISVLQIHKCCRAEQVNLNYQPWSKNLFEINTIDKERTEKATLKYHIILSIAIENNLITIERSFARQHIH